MAKYETTEAMAAANPPVKKRKGRVGFATTAEGKDALNMVEIAPIDHRSLSKPREDYKKVSERLKKIRWPTPDQVSVLNEATILYEEAKAADEEARRAKDTASVREAYAAAVETPAGPAVGKSRLPSFEERHQAAAAEFAEKQDKKLKNLLGDYQSFLSKYSEKHRNNALAKDKLAIIKEAGVILSTHDASQRYQKVSEWLNQHEPTLSKPVSAGDGFFARIKQAIFECLHPELKSRGADMVDHFKTVVGEQRQAFAALDAEKEVLKDKDYTDVDDYVPPPSSRRR